MKKKRNRPKGSEDSDGFPQAVDDRFEEGVGHDCDRHGEDRQDGPEPAAKEVSKYEIQNLHRKKLAFPESGDDVEACRTDRRKEPADDAHKDRKDHRPDDDVR